MKETNSKELKDPETEEAVFSLSDIPITHGAPCKDIFKEDDGASQDDEFFEFFNDVKAEMCAAEDIFYSGKILPYKAPPPSHQCRRSTRDEDGICNISRRSIMHARWESFDDFHESWRRSRTPSMRSNSLLVDYRELQRVSGSNLLHKSTSVATRVSGCNSFRSRDLSVHKVSSSSARLKWYLFRFGLMKVPAEMEMKDIRNRMRRRSPSPSLLSVLDGKKTVTVTGREVVEAGKRPWRLLRALSCNGNAHDVITASLSCISHV